MSKIQDPEVEVLAGYSTALQSDYPDNKSKAWQGSPFEWITKKTSRQKGAIGEKLIAGYLACKGFDVIRSPDSEADRIIAGSRAEIKMSTRWENDRYKFQQLRNQNYEFVVCLGISPFDAHCWVIPKKEVLSRWKKGDIKSQHTGAGGTDTAWLDVKLDDNIPKWLNKCGGSLSEAVELIAKITGQKPL